MTLAERLWNARVQGTRIDMTTVEVPIDEDMAYEIQDAVSQVADAKIIGFKLGATSEAALEALEKRIHLLESSAKPSGEDHWETNDFIQRLLQFAEGEPTDALFSVKANEP